MAIGGNVGIGRKAESQASLCLANNNGIALNITPSPLTPTLCNIGDVSFNGMLRVYMSDNFMHNVPGFFFTQVGDESVANTTVESSLIHTPGIGTLDIPANTLTPGRLINFRCVAMVKTNTPAQSTTMRFYLGNTVINYPVVIAMPVLTNPTQCEFNVWLQCVTEGEHGTVRLIGRSIIGSTLTAVRNIWSGDATSFAIPVEINTTIPLTFNVTYQWGAANVNNVCNTYILTCEMIN